MKQLYPNYLCLRSTAILVLSVLISTGLFAQVFTGNVLIQTQTDLNNFTQTGAPGGAKFTTVDGNFVIAPTASLTNFTNLSEIEDINGNLEIDDYSAGQPNGNPLSTFTSLTTVDRLLIIDDGNDNAGITAITNTTLTSITIGDLEIGRVNNVETLTLSSLTSVAESFILRNNQELTGFNLNNLTTIGQDININGNASLINLAGLRGVSSVGRGILIRNNPSLISANRLAENSPDRLEIQNLTVQNNDNIEAFGGRSDDLRVTVLNALIFDANDALETISTNIEVGLNNASITDQTLTDIQFTNNPELRSINTIFDETLPLTTTNFILENNLRLNRVNGQGIRVLGSISIINNPLITNLPNFTAGSLARTVGLTGSLVITDNDQLTTTEELVRLEEVLGNINVERNGALTNLSVFSVLELANAIVINENGSITSLDAFTADVLVIDSAFTITNNANLGDCCAPTCKTTVDGGQFDGFNSAVIVSGNTGDCADKQTVVDACNDEPGKSCLATAAPVEFIAFTGELNGSYVVLNWATATETENDYFQVERSTDGATYEAIAQVTGAGDSQEELAYSYLDYDYSPGVNYYRLRQVDYDGTQDFSDVIVVNAGGAVATVLGIYPNPASGSEVNVSLDNNWNADKVTLDVFSTSGQHVLQLSSANGARFSLPTDRLSPGMYAVRVSDGDRTLTERLVIK